MSMMKSDAMKIAHLVMVIRAGWDFAGIMAALAKAPEEASFGSIAVAMITAAEDQGALTPAAFVNRVYWPTWSVRADDDRSTARAVAAERERSRRILAELKRDAELAAPPDRVREILAAVRVGAKS